jgi:site-specific DNA-methyltransferase (adenine-specific)
MEVNKIIQGNCLDFIESIPGNAFLISDPPYNQKYHYDNYNDNLDKQEYRDLLFQVFGDRKSVIIHYPEETINILATLDIGKCEDVVSWVYNSNTAKQHRLITWWNCKPDMKKIPQPYKNPTDKRIAKRIEEGKACRGYDWWEVNQVKNVSKKDIPHSCPIPEEVARKIILSTTKEEDLVVDPFCGSGTILKVAKELKRNFIGYELSKEYCKLAEDRIRATPGGLFTS